jgi:hypothetical protein
MKLPLQLNILDTSNTSAIILEIFSKNNISKPKINNVVFNESKKKKPKL